MCCIWRKEPTLTMDFLHTPCAIKKCISAHSRVSLHFFFGVQFKNIVEIILINELQFSAHYPGNQRRERGSTLVSGGI